jgi:hypothetical protein
MLLEAGINRHVPASKRQAVYELIVNVAKVCKVVEVSSERVNDLMGIDKVTV